jgi:tetratricopeptide (TPR) repeat protein
VHSFDTGLVDIAREFLLAYQLLRKLIARYRTGELRFEELQEFVGDGEASVLFRLKERCHALFRTRARSGDLALMQGALFDLAVGSLFHEAMKLRENFYQLASYGPKVRALRAEAGPEADRLFEEFEKILSASKTRIEEAFLESETLLQQTRELFRVLLAAHPNNGLVARYLLENASFVEQVLGDDLDDFLARIYGETVQGYVLAAYSYLASGYFEEATRALEEALRHRPERDDLQRLAVYAQGMQAYLEARYGDAVRGLERWLDAKPVGDELGLARMARAALSRVGGLLEGSDLEASGEQAAALAARLESWIANGAGTPGSPSRSAQDAG